MENTFEIMQILGGWLRFMARIKDFKSHECLLPTIDSMIKEVVSKEATDIDIVHGSSSPYKNDSFVVNFSFIYTLDSKRFAGDIDLLVRGNAFREQGLCLS